MSYRVGTARQTTLLSGFLKLKGTLVKITRPPSGGPFVPRKAHEGTVSQGDQELGLRHHGSRYLDNPGLRGQATHCPYPLHWSQVTEIPKHMQSVPQRHTSWQTRRGVVRGTRKR